MSQDAYFPELGHGSSIGPNKVFTNPLSAWYAENDGPWDPLTLPSNGPDARNGAYALPNQPMKGFLNYRDTVPPSETDTISVLNNTTLPSDSGYISYTKRSVADPSLCDERLDNGTEFGSIIGDFAGLTADMNTNHDFNVLQKSPIDFQQSLWESPFDHAQVNKQSVSTSIPSLWCEECKMQLRTNSEKKKHIKRHTKPHRCNVAGCSRQIGFGTINDLDRHKKSRHPELYGPDEFQYKCSLAKCANFTKLWPRADNFRSHLRRVHKVDDLDDPHLEKYRHRPQPTEMTTSPEILTPQRPDGIVSDHQQSEILPRSPWEFTQGMLHGSPDQISRSRHNHSSTSAHGGNSHYSHSQLNDDVQWARPPSATSASSALRTSAFSDKQSRRLNLHTPQESNQHYTCHIADQVPAESSQDHKHSHLAGGEGSGDIDEDTPGADGEILLDDAASGGPESDSHYRVDLDSPEAVKKLLEALQKRGYLDPQGSDKAVSVVEEVVKSELATTSSSKSLFGCRLCNKSFSRRCELRKHEKRHDKPFGCTFVGCIKRFGSKNDWKRHENSQHLMVEFWKCDEPHVEIPSESCGRISHLRENFKYHLSTTHNLRDASAIDAKIEQCRIGRNYDERFWCGFCEKIIQTKSTGQGAWTERFDHIGDHYAGRNKVPQKVQTDWRHVDPDDIDSKVAITETEGPSNAPEEDIEVNGDSEPESKSHIKNKIKRARDTSGTTEGGPRKRNTHEHKEQE